MRKLLLLFVGLLFLAGSSWGQQIITIGTGTANNSIPINPKMDYNYSQIIYLQSEINTSGDITTLEFQYYGANLSNSRAWTIYMGHTSKSEFSSTTDWMPVGEMTQVFNGTIANMGGPGWLSIDITDFAYNNTDNLVIAVDENTAGVQAGNNYFQSTASTTVRSIRFNAGSNPDPASPPTASAIESAYANVRLNISAGLTAPVAATNVAPLNSATNIANGTPLNWTLGANTAEYQVVLGTNSTPTIVVVDFTTTLANSYTPAGLLPNTTYYWQVNAKNATGTTPGTVWSFTTAPAAIPAPVAATNVAPLNSATNIANGTPLSWTLGANTAEYQVVLGTNSTPTTVVVEYTTTMATSYTPAGLLPNTTYYWQVNAKNATATTPGPVWSFTTAAGGPTTTQLNEDFEGEWPLGGAVLGWLTVNLNETNPTEWKQTQFDGDHTTGTGSYATYTCYNYNVGRTAALVTPALNVTANENVFSFWAKYILAEGTYGSSDQLYVEVSKDNGTTWTTSTTNIVAGKQDLPWFKVILDLHNYEGQNYTGEIVKLRFRAISNYGSYNIGIDDVVFSDNVVAPPAPVAVTNVAPLNGAINIENGSLLSWTFGENTNEYQVMLGTSNPPTTAVVDFTTTLANSYTPSGLLPNTTYFWQVNARNETGTTPGVVWSFTTAAPIAAPVAVTNVAPLNGATDIKNGSLLSWSFGDNTDAYQVILGTTNPPTDTVVAFTTSLATSYQLSGLAHNTTYYWQVNAANASDTTAGAVWSFKTNTPSFYESFEGEAFPPADWAAINGNNQNDFWVRGVWADYAVTGVGFARINHNDDQPLDDWLITPKFAPVAGNSTLSFWARSQNPDLEKFNVMLSTTSNNKADFTVTLASGVQPSNSYNYYSYDLSAYNGQAVYVAVQAVSTGWTWGLFLDDFEGPNVYSGTTPAPGAVTNVSPLNGATNVSNGSSLSWTFGDNTDAYQVILGTTNPPTDTVVAFTTSLATSYQLSGLAHNTTYYWQVNAANATDTTAGAVWNFTTNTPSFYESFEGEAFPPAEWAVINGNNQNEFWERGVWADYAVTGLGFARINHNDNQPLDDWLITPKFAPVAGNSTLTFWARSLNSDLEKFNVMLSTTGIVKEDFTVTLASDVQPSTTYTYYSYDLSAYNGQTVYVAVQAVSTGWTYSLFLDDFEGPNVYSGTTPAPGAVTNVSPLNGATNVSNGSSLSWTFGDNTAEYQVILGTMNPPTNVVVDFTSTLATSYLLAGLDANTEYFWQINAKNETATTLGPVWGFTTGASCDSFPGPEMLTYQIVDNNNVKLNWGTPTLGDFFEGFESGPLPTGWLRIDADGDGYNWMHSTEFFAWPAHSGQYCMGSASYVNDVGPVTPNNYLITPSIQVTADSKLKFWIAGVDPSWPAEKLKVKISTTGNQVADFTTTLNTYTATASWKEIVVDLSAFAGQSIHIALVHTDVTDMFWIKLDDVTVTNTVTRAAYTSPATAGVSNTIPFKTQGMNQSEIDSKMALVRTSDFANATVIASKGRDFDPGAYESANVYRNGVLIAEAVIDSTYTDENLEPGLYNYCVTYVYENGGESCPDAKCLEVILGEDCIAPHNLTASIADGNEVTLEWNQESATEFRYDDGTSTNSLGFDPGGTINSILGAKHTTSAVLTEMSWFTTADSGPHNTVQIYVFGLTTAGIPDATNILYTAAVSNADNTWNTHTFPTPVTATGGFYIGMGYDGYAALGTDDGVGAPYAFQNNTHYYTEDYTTNVWETFEGSGFSLNALIRAIGVSGAKASYAVSPTVAPVEGSGLVSTSNNPVATGTPQWSTPAGNANRAVLGYNIYKNGTLLKALWPETTYSYKEGGQGGQACYTVTAAYEFCGESVPSNEACVTLVDVKSNDLSQIRVYPNPSNSILNIELTDNVSQVVIYNYLGQVVLENNVTNTSKLQVDVSNYEAGAYLVRFISNQGQSITRKIVVSK